MSEELQLECRQQTRRPQMPEVNGDSPLFEGTCVPVQYLFTYLDTGHSLYTFMKDHLEVIGEQALRAIRQRVGAEIPAESIPGKVSGTPVFKGSRLPIQRLFEYLADGESINDYMESYPSADREQVVRLLRLAERLMEAVAYEISLGREQPATAEKAT